MITSVLATCHDQGVNGFEYLVAVQRHKEAVRRTPDRWLPWNFEEAMEELAGADPPAEMAAKAAA